MPPPQKSKQNMKCFWGPFDPVISQSMSASHALCPAYTGRIQVQAHEKGRTGLGLFKHRRQRLHKSLSDCGQKKKEEETRHLRNNTRNPTAHWHALLQWFCGSIKNAQKNDLPFEKQPRLNYARTGAAIG